MFDNRAKLQLAPVTILVSNFLSATVKSILFRTLTSPLGRLYEKKVQVLSLNDGLFKLFNYLQSLLCSHSWLLLRSAEHPDKHSLLPKRFRLQNSLPNRLMKSCSMAMFHFCIGEEVNTSPPYVLKLEEYAIFYL